jgi:hypothetical protein
VHAEKLAHAEATDRRALKQLDNENGAVRASHVVIGWINVSYFVAEVRSALVSAM